MLSERVRRRIAWRLLPFIFFLYLIQILDGFNVSFAALRMKTELGFSDTVYGIGASLLTLGYVLLEIPGVILIERWSARKWLTRIMVSWGLVTILTAVIHSAVQFYVVRLLLGAAEASFYPGIIVYLTHWFSRTDRARAVAAFNSAAPLGAFLGSATAAWLLGVRWMRMSGWRWLFIIEGIPAVIAGAITLFYLTDRPSEAQWLSAYERSEIIGELALEHAAKTKRGHLGFWDACKDSRLLLLLAGYFFFLMAVVTNAFWMPAFLQRLSNLPATTVAKLVMLPAIAGVAGLFINSWSSDRLNERKWHTVVSVFCAGCCYLPIAAVSGRFPIVVLLFTVYYFFYMAVYPNSWAIPTTFLSETTAAAAFGLINSVGQTGAFLRPSIVEYLNDTTHSIHGSLIFIAGSMLLSALTLSFLPSAVPMLLCAKIS